MVLTKCGDTDEVKGVEDKESQMLAVPPSASGTRGGLQMT